MLARPTPTAQTPTQFRLRDFAAGLRAPETRARHVMEQIEPCRGLTPEAIRRANQLAARVLGLPYAVARRRIHDALVRGVESLVAFVQPLPPDVVGYVYEAQDPTEPALVKVGFSRDPIRRMAELGALNRTTMRLLAVRPGTMLDEHAEHCRRAADRVFGEWFLARTLH